MSYPAYVTGRITITPPLSHTELTARPELAGHGKDHRQAWVHVTETTIETPEGTLTRREGAAIVAYSGDESPWTLGDDLLEISRAFPDREYGGYLELRYTDDGTRTRMGVKDGEVTEVQGRLIWPGDPGWETAGA